jgi:hypothetical protein
MSSHGRLMPSNKKLNHNPIFAPPSNTVLLDKEIATKEAILLQSMAVSLIKPKKFTVITEEICSIFRMFYHVDRLYLAIRCFSTDFMLKSC